MSHPSRSLPGRCGPVFDTTRNRSARPGLKSALAALPGAVALALGAWGMVGAGAAWAQTSPGASPAPAAADSGQLTTITVTATRRIEDQQKVSTSVTALSAEKLAERNIYDIGQFEGLSPGFTFGRSGSDARPAMRGVRTEAVQANADTTIGFFIDGIYKSRPSQALASFVDLERREFSAARKARCSVATRLAATS